MVQHGQQVLFLLRMTGETSKGKTVYYIYEKMPKSKVKKFEIEDINVSIVKDNVEEEEEVNEDVKSNVNDNVNDNVDDNVDDVNKVDHVNKVDDVNKVEDVKETVNKVEDVKETVKRKELYRCEKCDKYLPQKSLNGSHRKSCKGVINASIKKEEEPTINTTTTPPPPLPILNNSFLNNRRQMLYTRPNYEERNTKYANLFSKSFLST